MPLFPDTETSKLSYSEMKAIFIKKMERVRTHCCLAVDKSPSKESKHKVLQVMDMLEDVSDAIVAYCSRRKGRSFTPVKFFIFSYLCPAKLCRTVFLQFLREHF